ncbi:lipase chaperone family protein [Alteromonas oceanisediminis]|uniref:lipase chaperone family protein n=1 Tax=Alteromonas oceanisediminis TaxID=2836180 RepID=UPI001BD96C50|nr:lipase chaperone family protein [Alteromonas oceanisediminis]MBT0585457.1 hypothetical protein [Alteromonas oceanisediminis]
MRGKTKGRLLALIVFLLASALLGADYWFGGNEQLAEEDAWRDTSDKASNSLASITGSANATPENTRDFIIDHETRAEFDAFIFSHQELHANFKPDAIKQAFAQQAISLYSPHTAEYAILLFSRYIDYKAALAEVDEPIDDRTEIDSLAARLQQRDDLRHKFFSVAEYRVLFASEAAFDQAALARLAVSASKDLPVAEKRRLVMQNIASLPPEQRAGYEPSLDIERLKTLRAVYPKSTTRFSAVAAEFGSAVAERLETYEQEEAVWQQRVEAHRQWLSQLPDSLSTKARQRKIDEQVAGAFSKTEQRRLRVYLDNPDL